MMAKGTYAIILLAAKDLAGTFERLLAGDADVVQELTERPYGIRDCAFRDPAGNLIRIQELHEPSGDPTPALPEEPYAERQEQGQ